MGPSNPRSQRCREVKSLCSVRRRSFARRMAGRGTGSCVLCVDAKLPGRRPLETADGGDWRGRARSSKDCSYSSIAQSWRHAGRMSSHGNGGGVRTAFTDGPRRHVKSRGGCAVLPPATPRAAAPQTPTHQVISLRLRRAPAPHFTRPEPDNHR